MSDQLVLRPDATETLRALLQSRILVLDGAMGTMIQQHSFSEAEYRAGLRLEQARRAFLGADTAAARQVYGERLARGTADQWAARQTAIQSDPGAAVTARRRAGRR